jgi:hypothetical protein
VVAPARRGVAAAQELFAAVLEDLSQCTVVAVEHLEVLVCRCLEAVGLHVQKCISGLLLRTIIVSSKANRRVG